jgi:hypothetical protein
VTGRAVLYTSVSAPTMYNPKLLRSTFKTILNKLGIIYSTYYHKNAIKTKTVKEWCAVTMENPLNKQQNIHYQGKAGKIHMSQ